MRRKEADMIDANMAHEYFDEHRYEVRQFIKRAVIGCMNSGRTTQIYLFEDANGEVHHKEGTQPEREDSFFRLCVIDGDDIADIKRKIIDEYMAKHPELKERMVDECWERMQHRYMRELECNMQPDT